MARKPTQAELFDELLSRYEKSIADAFKAAIAELRRASSLADLIRALQRGDVAGAIAALQLEPAAFNVLSEQVRSAYVEGGTVAAGLIKPPEGAGFTVRFDGRNPRAEAWVREQSSTLVTRILDDQRTAIRAAVARSIETGANPRTAGLEIVGRINRATGVREGGIIGLSAPQEAAYAAARQELASSDPADLKNYLTRQLRDKRFDRSVAKAIRDEVALSAETAAKAARQYQNRLLALRGETIGLTEGLASLQAAKREVYLQAVEDGKISEASIRRTWRDVGDLRVRHTHRIMDGETVGLNEPFRSPSGARLMFPGDTSLGAPGAETIRCRCDVNYRIDFLANLD